MRRIINHIAQIPGWKSKRKFFVIESDDWGSIRMSGKTELEKLIQLGIPLQNDLYNQFDTLETDSDMQELFEVLSQVKDFKGNHPVITANTVMANPDWNKISNSKYKEYHFESFTNTLNENLNSRNVLNLYFEGIKNGMFFPQFHGREHLNVKFWMESLNDGDEYIRSGFDQRVFGIPLKHSKSNRNNVMASFDILHDHELSSIEQSIQDGLNMFERQFHYRSKTIIAPCYIWPTVILPNLKKFGIEGIQGIKYQFEPQLGSKKYKKIFHYTGEKSHYGQHYLVRNVFFEPTHFYLGNPNYLENLMKDIRLSFLYRNPVIMGSHRINFMGGLDVMNREVNLDLLLKLLKRVKCEFPDVEFVNTAQLLKILQDDKI